MVLLGLLLLFTAATGAHPAQEAQQAAMKLANEGKLGEALPLFKRACRCDNRDRGSLADAVGDIFLLVERHVEICPCDHDHCSCRLAPREAHYFNNLGVTQLVRCV